jgi:broad specificity phosphatase PhoE
MRYLLAALLLILSAGQIKAQTTTYILFRHAEKDTTTQGSTMMQADPPLSAAGEKRAASIPELLKDYKPDLFYTTNFKRTRATIAPLAQRLQKEPQTYDHRNLKAFAELLLQEKGKTIVVAGHSNTTPSLANLLIGENRFQPLDESVYNQYWIITLTEGQKPVVQVLTY